MKRFMTLALVAGLLGPGAAAVAQTAPATPTPPPPPRETFAQATVFGAPRPGQPLPGQPVALRRAAPEGAVSNWLPETDQALNLAQTNTRATGSGRLELAVFIDGTVTSCQTREIVGDARLFDGLCDRVSERAKFRPAIDESGVPLMDVYVFYVRFGRVYARPSSLVEVRMPSPAPPPPEGQWPPVSDSQLVSVSGLDLLPGGPMDPAAAGAPWAGVVYTPENPKAPCRIVKSSGDAAFNATVCRAAAKGRYDLSRAKPPNGRRMQLHFVQADGKTWGLVPVQKFATRPSAPVRSMITIQQALAALPPGGAARVRLGVTVDPTGTIAGCTVEVSSGSDASDVALCTAVRRSGPFVPAKDIFGRPFQAYLYDWAPASVKPGS